MMAYLEGEKGIYGIKGGTYRLVEAFETLAKELGVQIHLNEQVNKIHVKGIQRYFSEKTTVSGSNALHMLFRSFRTSFKRRTGKKQPFCTGECALCDKRARLGHAKGDVSAAFENKIKGKGSL